MRTSKFLTSKDLITSNMLNGSPSRREIQHDIHRRFITPSVWKVQKDHVQTTASRGFITLQKKFAKELTRILKLVVYEEYTPIEARRLSKKLFIEFYKKAYILGVKTSGAGISTGYSLFVNKPSVTPDISSTENKWSEASAKDELSFWNKFLNAVTKESRLVSSYDYRILMYVRALESHFDAGRVVGAPHNSVIYWTQSKGHSACPGCSYMARISPVPKEAMVTTPRAGMCSCLSNCKCSIKIVPKTADEVRKIRNDTPPKELIIKEMKRRKYS